MGADGAARGRRVFWGRQGGGIGEGVPKVVGGGRELGSDACYQRLGGGCPDGAKAEGAEEAAGGVCTVKTYFPRGRGEHEGDGFWGMWLVRR